MTVRASFNGQVFVPDEPVNLPPGTTVTLDINRDQGSTPRFIDLLEVASDVPDAPVDLAAQHDHYLYGAEKR